MEKISLEFFELIGAALPGIPIYIIGCFAISGIPFSFFELMDGIEHLSISEATFSLLTCYCIGFCIHFPAYEVFKDLVKHWKKRTVGKEISLGKREKELVRVRHITPENFKLLNKFFALRMMGYSMFFSMWLFAEYLIVDSLYYKSLENDSYIAFIICGVFGFLFLRRAVDFHWRSQVMIDEIITMLDTQVP